MQALRLDEVLRRVVAWHNRHPLARRITASQVHSIGEVVLPFASAQPLRGAPPAATSEAAAPVQVPAPAVAAPPTATDPPPDTDTDTDTDAQAAADPTDVEIDIALPDTGARPSVATDDQDSGDAALDMPPLGADLDGAVDAAAGDPTPGPDPAEAADVSATPSSAAPLADAEPAAAEQASLAPAEPPADEPVGDNSLDGKPRWRPADPALRPPRPAPPPASAAALQPPAQRGGSARGWLVALRTALSGRQPGFPRLRAVFSRDFIWPLRPSQVARWVQRHGQPDPLAPTDWPQRVVDTDAMRLSRARQKGLPHLVQLHVLTAAIGVGDRRIRVLIDGRGAVIGPRAYQRSRVAAASSLLLAAAVGLGWGLRPPGTPGGEAEAGASLASLAASAAAAAAASAASAPADVTVAAGPVQTAASGPTDAAASAASASAPASASSGPVTAVAHAETAASAVDPHPAGAAASAAQASLRPDLAAEAGRTAVELAAAASAAADPAPPVVLPTVYAVVTRPSRMRQTAVDFLPTMRSASALLRTQGPDQREVMHSEGKWFAAWWPFATLADAERARVLLAGRGLKTSVVEF